MQSNAENECKGSDEQTIDNTINDTTGHTTSDDTQRVMSKNQMKKLLRHKKWLETRPERRRQEKERKKLKAKKLREEGIEMKSRSALRKQWIPMSQSKCKVSVCIDCDFEDYMEDNDMKKLVKQIGRCYAFNRHSSAPVQLYITSIKSKMKEAFVRSQPGFANWDAICVDRHWSEVFADKQKVIYLSSDSEDIIPEPNSICESNDYVFVIGGLVDHNRHKGLCHRLAVQQSVKHGRLPIDEYIEMTQRRVLAVNHVFEIMLLASNGSSSDWSDIFKKVIPIRKMKQ